ncbi:MAG TPA: radical SAM family heme chaperone HemW [Candidatus Dormibacteraeota bacterium]|nr:radical SAM family heme chaperone HemW [Candidatus Dormibacteraeota bacterium]
MAIGIYVQVPFCQTRCTYCNFHTGVVSRDQYLPYVDAICREIGENEGAITVEADTIYIGGGTPSLLEPSALAKILQKLRGVYAGEPSEVTLEADPETVTPEKAAQWRNAGINRISLGAQSFQDNELKAAGRMHRRDDIYRAADLLRAAGIRNISMDLIAGLPHQTRQSWEDSVSQLLRIYPEHISIYMLEIDEGSRLGREALSGGERYSAGALPSDDDTADFYDSARERLKSAGYEHYEVSNWGLPGKQSQHNLKYWRRDAYIGFGAGAHSFDGAIRWANVHESPRYVRLIDAGTSVREQIEPVTPPVALSEDMFLGLRQLRGADFARIEKEYSVEPVLRDRLAMLRLRIETLQSHGMLEFDGTFVRIPPEKLTISSEILLELLS